MKLSILAGAVASAMMMPAVASAGQVGTNIGYGPAGGEHSVFGSLTNPVNNYSGLNGSNFGLGISATAEGEVSGAENLFDNFESTIQAAADLAALPEATADAFTAQYNNAMIYGASSIDVPLLVKTAEYGNISVEYNKSAGFMAKSFEHNQSNGSLLIADVQLGMQTSYAEKTELAVGFAREMTSVDVANTFGDGAKVVYGVKGRLVQAGGNVHAYNFNRNLLSTNDTEQEIEDIISTINDDVSTNSAFTADMGIRVETPNWNAGMTVKNLVPVDVDLAVKHNAFATADMGGFYATKFEMNRYATIDGSMYSEDRNWKVSAYIDTNEHTNFAGLEEQNAGVHASYATDTAYLPDVRVGIDKNLKTDMSKTTLGLTMGPVSLDMSASDFGYDSDKAKSQQDFAGALALSVEAEF